MRRNRLKNAMGRRILFSGLTMALLFCAGFSIPIKAAPASEKSGYGSYLAGRYAQSQHDMANAARYFSEALRFDPNNAALLQQAYILLSMDGRVTESATLAERAAREEPSDLALTIIAVQDMKEGRFAQAEKNLARVSKHDAGAIALQAWASFGEGRPAGQLQTALKILAPLNEAQGLSRMYRLHAGLMADLSGQASEAEKYYASLVNEATTLPPYIVEIIGTFFQRNGQMDRAKELYTKFVSSDMEGFLIDTKAMLAAGRSVEPPVKTAKDGAAEVLFGVASSVFFSRPTSGQEGNDMSFAAEQDQSVDLSLLLVRLGLHLRPDAPRARLLLGDIFSTRNRLDEANTAYLSINAKSPIFWTGQIKAAENMAFMKKVDEALAVLQKVEKTYPGRIEPILSQADILRQNKQWDGAAEAYGKAIEHVDPQSGRNWFLFYGRGISYERSKQWDKAEADLQHALKLHPDQAEVLNYLGYSWIEMGKNLDQAMKMIEKAVAQRPQDGYIIDSLGWAHYRLGQYDKAVAILEQAIMFQPQDPTINDHLGDALWQAGHKTEARYQWQRALSFSPEPEDAVKIQKKLDGAPPENIPVRNVPDKSKSVIPL